MSRRKVSPVAVDEFGAEVHPSFAVIGVSRVSATPPKSLFDSEIEHGQYVVVRISRARRRREARRDWINSGKEIVEVAMSTAQWASFVSSFNHGDGVPCTLTSLGDAEFDPNVDEAPYEPRMRQQMADVRDAGHRLVEDARVAFEAVEEARRAGGKKALDEALHHLGCVLGNTPVNLEYAAKALSEHVEGVVNKAKADIEAMANRYAEQTALTAAGVVLELPAGTDSGGVR